MSLIRNSVASRDRNLPGPAASRPLSFTSDLKPSAYFRWKGILDRVLAAVLLIPALPIIGLLVVLVRLTSRGPGVFRQSRVGKNGRKFMMYKIRTMRHDAEAETGAVWTKALDPRVTPIGKVLRKLHLDELPQLFNVVQGEMSLAGPRPERPEFVYVLAAAIPGYLDRLAIPPGVTGLAQLNLPPDSNLDSVRRKLALDLEYVRRAGLLLDIRLLLCTFGRMFKLPEWILLRIFRLSRQVAIPESPVPPANGSNHCAATPTEIAAASHHRHPGPDGTTAGDGKPAAKPGHTSPKPR